MAAVCMAYGYTPAEYRALRLQDQKTLVEYLNHVNEQRAKGR